MTVNKRLNKKGGLTIPQAVRHAVGIVPGAPLDVEDAGDGIIIHKHMPSCCICGSTIDVITVEKIEICAVCAERLSKLAKEKKEGHDGK